MGKLLVEGSLVGDVYVNYAIKAAVSFVHHPRWPEERAVPDDSIKQVTWFGMTR
jgi:hypothetical protein